MVVCGSGLYKPLSCSYTFTHPLSMHVRVSNRIICWGGGGGCRWGAGRGEKMEGRIDYFDSRFTLIESCHKVTELTTGTTKGYVHVAVA